MEVWPFGRLGSPCFSGRSTSIDVPFMSCRAGFHCLQATTPRRMGEVIDFYIDTIDYHARTPIPGLCMYTCICTHAHLFPWVEMFAFLLVPGDSQLKRPTQASDHSTKVDFGKTLGAYLRHFTDQEPQTPSHSSAISRRCGRSRSRRIGVG